MANVTKKAIGVPRSLGGVPYGNMTALRFNLTTDSSGIWADSDKAVAIADGDVLRLGILPKGITLLDYIAKISDAFASSTTMKIGFAYVDGVDVSATPQDDDYFCGATTMATQAVLRQTNVAVAPITLPKDAYLILTSAGAAQSAVGILDVTVIGICDLA